jgi:hypothetical protein
MIEGSESGAISLTNDPGGPKTFGLYGSRSRSATLPVSFGALSSCTQENEKNLGKKK